MLKAETEREEDGRWIAEVAALPGVMTYGATRAEAVSKAEALALRVLAIGSSTVKPCPSSMRSLEPSRTNPIMACRLAGVVCCGSHR